MIKMVTIWRKNEIMANKNKLKRTKIYIERDLNEEDMTGKGKLLTEMKKLKSKGHEVIIRGKSLIVNTDTEKKNDKNDSENKSTIGKKQ